MTFEYKDLKLNYWDQLETIKERYKESSKNHLLSWIRVVPPQESEIDGSLIQTWELPGWYDKDVIEDAIGNRLWKENVDYCEWSTTENKLVIVYLKGASK